MTVRATIAEPNGRINYGKSERTLREKKPLEVMQPNIIATKLVYPVKLECKIYHRFAIFQPLFSTLLSPLLSTVYINLGTLV